MFVISLSVLSMKNVNALDSSYYEEFTYSYYFYIIKGFNNIGYAPYDFGTEAWFDYIKP